MTKGSYWLDGIQLPTPTVNPLPTQVDVIIVGAGYTGLCAAYETAKKGLSTLVIDQGSVGQGCSSLNGGQVAHSIKPSIAELSGKHGASIAQRIHAEATDAVENLRRLATVEGLDCDWRPNGGFLGAYTAKHFDDMRREADAAHKAGNSRITLIQRQDVHREVMADRYYGGMVYHDDASIHPARLVCALYERALKAGVVVSANCGATAIERTATGFLVRTTKGTIAARKVLIATNGYTGPLSPWHQRRVIPIGSYQIATEELGTERVKQLIPHARNVCDTRRVVIYLRPSPDGKRIIFGGRAALSERDPSRCTSRLINMLESVFPSLKGVQASHAWVGFIAYTFDTLPHLGEQDGLYHCLGYCGQGVPLATYYGMRIGQQIAGLKEGKTALDGLRFQTRPLYHGKPWFLAPSILVYRALDSLGW